MFFSHQREGKDRKCFRCYKLRTFPKNAVHPKPGEPITTSIPRLGTLLRSSGVDELPQVLNIFKGEMSVVGPRPHMLKHTKDYAKIIDGFMVRHLVLPGITGSAQVNGFRGETKCLEDMQNRVKYDVWYIENWTLLLDIKIIFLTIINLIKGSDNAV